MTDVLAGQVLRFQWNNYTTSWGPAIRDLRRAGLFHDLTLVTSDNQLVTAHRIVLAACSAFFRGQISLETFSPPHTSLKKAGSIFRNFVQVKECCTTK